MSELHIPLSMYNSDTRIEVSIDDGQCVNLKLTPEQPSEPGLDRMLTHQEASALAAALSHFAAEARYP